MAPANPGLSVAVLNFTQSLIVVCCNGGLPFVDLHVWPIDGVVFHPVDPTDWVATQTEGNQLNTSIHPEVENLVSTLNLPDHIDLSICDAYNLTFGSRKLRQVFSLRNGSLACRCPRAYYGSSCHLLDSQAVHGGTAHSFRIFLFLAIIPLSFALIAAIGGFVLKMCCCDCYNMSLGSCTGKDQDEEVQNNDDTALWEDDTQPLDENTYNRCLQAVNKDEQQRQKSYLTKWDGASETSQFIPTMITAETTNKYGFTPLVPVPTYPVVKRSPPPSYKADDSPLSSPRPRPVSMDACTQTQTVIW